MLIELPYDREKAVAYAHTWAYRRNPRYLDFQNLGGDCTNFASQCIFAGAGVMNYTPTFGWYYRSASDRAPAWTGVGYLYDFLTGNRGAGPAAAETTMEEIEPGDICQLRISGSSFHHCPVIVRVVAPVSPETIFVAAHTRDADYRPLSTYAYKAVRFLHITQVRAYGGE